MPIQDLGTAYYSNVTHIRAMSCHQLSKLAPVFLGEFNKLAPIFFCELNKLEPVK